MATTLSPEVQLMRRRVRHIHIPDLPPIYAPRSLAPNIRDHIAGQITRQRALIEEPPRSESEYGLAKVTAKAQTSFTSWLKKAGPPPTVLSFTRRPTYILPKHQVERQESWQVEYLTKALKSKMNIHFPEPPGWSSSPWRPSWEQKLPESEWKHDPLNHQWPEVGVLIMPCAEAMFLGPGQVSIWPIMDLKDEIQRGSGKLTTKYQYERILEDTTIELLKREFGINAFAIPGSSGVWVESRIPPAEVGAERSEGPEATNVPESLSGSLRRRNVRRIATVHASVAKHITQWGVSIHVGQPDPGVDAWGRSTNPWTPLRQHHTTTSIAAELSYMNSTASPLGPSRYLLTHFNHHKVPLRAGQGYMPYSRIKAESGRRNPAPLGMDNRDISTAWTYQFARQLGMSDGHVDHYSMVDENDTDATHLPTKHTGAGFRFRGVFTEDVMNSTYRQVEVPSIQVGRNEKAAPGIVESSLRLEHHDGRIDSASHEGWLLSWPLWESTLIKKLDDAICGGPCDTRLRAYELQKQASSRLQRRRTELRQAEEVEKEWRREMPQLIRRPLSDVAVRELADMSREMEEILKKARMGRASQKLLENTVQMRRLLESRFAGPLGGNAGAPEPELDEFPPATEAGSQKAPKAQVETSDSRKPSGRKASTGQADTSAGQEAPDTGTQAVDPTDNNAKEPARKPQERTSKPRERAKKASDLRRPPGWEPVVFTKTYAEKRREMDERRRAKQAAAAQSRDAKAADPEPKPFAYKQSGAAEDPGVSSQFLPNQHQIGGGGGAASTGSSEEELRKTQQMTGGS